MLYYLLQFLPAKLRSITVQNLTGKRITMHSALFIMHCKYSNQIRWIIQLSTAHHGFPPEPTLRNKPINVKELVSQERIVIPFAKTKLALDASQYKGRKTIFHVVILSEIGD